MNIKDGIYKLPGDKRYTYKVENGDAYVSDNNGAFLKIESENRKNHTIKTLLNNKAKEILPNAPSQNVQPPNHKGYITLSNPFNKTTTTLDLGFKPSWENYNENKTVESQINNGENINKIHEYHKKYKPNEYYTVSDKKEGTTSVYKNGILIKKYKSSFGANQTSDDLTVTYVDEKGKIRDGAGNLSSPAGIFRVTPTGKYHGHNAYMRQTENMYDKGMDKGIPSSLHVGNIQRFSNGCTRMEGCDLDDMGKYIQKGTFNYTLPVNDKNKFYIRNGQLQFNSYDPSKLPSHNSQVNSPVRFNTNAINRTYQNTEIDGLQKQQMNSFLSALSDNHNKEDIQKKFKINDDTYNELTKIAFGIMGAESQFGRQGGVWENLAKAVGKVTGFSETSPDVYVKDLMLQLSSDPNSRSRGLTQIRGSYLSDDVKEYIKSKGLDMNNLNDGRTAALITMYRLAHEYNNTGQNFDKLIRNWNQGKIYPQIVNYYRNKLGVEQDVANRKIIKHQEGGVIGKFQPGGKVEVVTEKSYQDWLKRNPNLPQSLNSANMPFMEYHLDKLIKSGNMRAVARIYKHFEANAQNDPESFAYIDKSKAFEQNDPTLKGPVPVKNSMLVQTLRGVYENAQNMDVQNNFTKGPIRETLNPFVLNRQNINSTLSPKKEVKTNAELYGYDPKFEELATQNAARSGKNITLDELHSDSDSSDTTPGDKTIAEKQGKDKTTQIDKAQVPVKKQEVAKVAATDEKVTTSEPPKFNIKAGVYSLKGDKTWQYQIDEKGNLSVKKDGGTWSKVKGERAKAAMEILRKAQSEKGLSAIKAGSARAEAGMNPKSKKENTAAEYNQRDRTGEIDLLQARTPRVEPEGERYGKNLYNLPKVKIPNKI